MNIDIFNVACLVGVLPCNDYRFINERVSGSMVDTKGSIVDEERSPDSTRCAGAEKCKTPSCLSEGQNQCTVVWMLKVIISVILHRLCFYVLRAI